MYFSGRLKETLLLISNVFNEMKNYSENNYCLILAGGKGKRL